MFNIFSELRGYKENKLINAQKVCFYIHQMHAVISCIVKNQNNYILVDNWQCELYLVLYLFFTLIVKYFRAVWVKRQLDQSKIYYCFHAIVY